MARIRTVKPDFFRHSKLFDLERRSGLPVRLAFAGLWCAADREGRFKWEPLDLKVECLPHDNLDFEAVLIALASGGFIEKYCYQEKMYGRIPSFAEHQVINNREQASRLPADGEVIDVEEELTRGPRVNDASSGMLSLVSVEGKGRERKGKEGEDVPSAKKYAWEGKTVRLTPADFAEFKKTYNAIPDFEAELFAADAYYTKTPPKDGKWFFPLVGWLKREHQKYKSAAKSAKADNDLPWQL